MLKEKAQELVNETNEVTRIAFKARINSDAIEYIDADSFNAMQKALKLVTHINEYLVTEAQVLDEIKSKLDKLQKD